MEADDRGVLGRWDATNEAIRAAMGRGIARALRDHKRIGNPVVTWDRQHDRIVITPPEEIAIVDDPGIARELGPPGGRAED